MCLVLVVSTRCNNAMSQLVDISNSPLAKLTARRPDSHKGDYGRALLIGGSRGMSGSISLSGMAALRSGAGLVSLAVPRTIQDVVASFHPAYMTHGLADDGEMFLAHASDKVLELSAGMTVLALGPGLGRSAEATQFVERIYREVPLPMVVDADALFALAKQPAVLRAPGGPRIVTPHPGEFARLTGRQNATGSASENTQRATAAGTFASASCAPGTIVVLKGHQTVITDGNRFAFNQTGNPGMATGGTGDVLTGVITALLCQGLEPFDAARLGVHLHGLAGDLAADKLGQVSLVASDLIDTLSAAFRSI